MSDTDKESRVKKWFKGRRSDQNTASELDTDKVAAPAPEQPTAPPAESEDTIEPAPDKTSFFTRLKSGLSRSSSKISDGVTGIFTKAKLDETSIEELEDLLITADLGVETVAKITAKLSAERFDKAITADEVKKFVADEVATILAPCTKPLTIETHHKPHVILIVGVNGSGKTTTIGKMAHLLSQQGHRVMLAAGDTFRAAAIEQLKIWGERVGAPVVASQPGADAAGLAFDALKRANQEAYDVLLIDTAGRLQNKRDLMNELEKVNRVLKKQDDTAPHSVLLVLDATTGQNAINQVSVFKQVADVTGLVMTKLDGTARGGILVALAAKFGLPIHAIGVGEGIDDFQAFDPQQFAQALVGISETPD